MTSGASTRKNFYLAQILLQIATVSVCLSVVLQQHLFSKDLERLIILMEHQIETCPDPSMWEEILVPIHQSPCQPYEIQRAWDNLLFYVGYASAILAILSGAVCYLKRGCYCLRSMPTKKKKGNNSSNKGNKQQPLMQSLATKRQ